MKELIQQQQILKRRRFINNLVLNLHLYLLPGIGINLIIVFGDISFVASITGIVMLVYLMTAFMCFLMPRMNNRSYDLTKEIQLLSERWERIEVIHQSLDDLRDSMLFDGDTRYWQLLETLATQK